VMSGLLLGMVLLVFTSWILNIHDLFVLILVHAHTSALCLVLPLFPCIW
jgi:hypothetical protein